MENLYVFNTGKDFFPDKQENVMTSIFKEYEKVIVESLITSFGLDFLLNDRHGGDVDTILNVRKIGKDSQMTYKNKINEETYNNLESYNSHEYHSHKNYVQKNKEVKSLREQGLLKDGYTGEKLSKSDLDHIVSAKSIHCDRGRVLSGLKGTDLANSNENLKATNPRTNRTKKADTMSKFLGKYGDEYTESQKKNMNAIYNNAEKSYDRKINIAYYTSSNFSKDLTSAAANVGIRMGIRQALGLVFTEIWFSIKEEFKNFDMAKYSKATFGMYHGDKTKVCIRFANHMCGVFIDRFGKDILFMKSDEDFSELIVDINVSPQFFGWIFSLGKDVEVVSPKKVVDEIRVYTREFLKKYE